MASEKKGWLVVLEGIDGAGKSTQCDRLEAWLRDAGHDVVRLFEPTNGPVGRQIRQLARKGRDEVSAEEEMRLFLKDREMNVRDNIRPALDRGAIVLMDRYYYSSIAYQGAKGLDPEYVRARNEEIAIPADIIFYIQIPVETAMERIRQNREAGADLFEREDYLARVKANFDAMDDPARETIDGTQSPDTVFRSMQAILKSRCL